MTGRERILAALAHKESDRTPIDFGGTESSGIVATAYNHLKRHLGIEGGATRVFDTLQQVALVEPEVRERFGSDAVVLYPQPRRWRQGTLPDGSRCELPEKWRPEKLPDGSEGIRDSRGEVQLRRPHEGLYFDPVSFPLASAETVRDIETASEVIENNDWPFYADESFEDFGRRARTLHETTDLAVVANLCLHVFAAGQMLRGFDTFLCDLLLNKSLATALMERLVDAYIRRIERLAPLVADYVDVVLVNDDLGVQDGPMLSPELYREMVRPHHARLWGFLKKAWGKPLLLHSCGSVRAFIPDFIEMGVDALNPVQVSAVAMDTSELKREFGRDICFWGGGCDTQHVLGSAATEKVREEVARRIAHLAPGGGFVFVQVHNIQANVPPENVVAMFDGARTAT